MASPASQAGCEKPRKKAKFSVPSVIGPNPDKANGSIPKAADIFEHTSATKQKPETHYVRPSHILLSRLGSATRAVGFDVETHDYEASVMQTARLVQIGWSVSGPDDAEPITPISYLVSPSNRFQVSHTHGRRPSFPAPPREQMLPSLAAACTGKQHCA